MTEYLVIFLPIIPYMHRIYMVLVNLTRAVSPNAFVTSKPSTRFHIYLRPLPREVPQMDERQHLFQAFAKASATSV